jgi:hypothetical protein
MKMLDFALPWTERFLRWWLLSHRQWSKQEYEDVYFCTELFSEGWVQRVAFQNDDKLVDACVEILLSRPWSVTHAWAAGCRRRPSWIGEKVMLLVVSKQAAAPVDVVFDCLTAVTRSFDQRFNGEEDMRDMGMAFVSCVAIKKTARRFASIPEYFGPALMVVARALYMHPPILARCPSVLPLMHDALDLPDLHPGTILCARNGLVSLAGTSHFDSFFQHTCTFVRSLVTNDFARLRVWEHCFQDLFCLFDLVHSSGMTDAIVLLCSLLQTLPLGRYSFRDIEVVCNVLALAWRRYWSQDDVQEADAKAFVSRILQTAIHVCGTFCRHVYTLLPERNSIQLFATLAFFWKESGWWAGDMFLSRFDDAYNVRLWVILTSVAPLYCPNCAAWVKALTPSISCREGLPLPRPDNTAYFEMHVVRVWCLSVTTTTTKTLASGVYFFSFATDASPEKVLPIATGLADGDSVMTPGHLSSSCMQSMSPRTIFFLFAQARFHHQAHANLHDTLVRSSN